MVVARRAAEGVLGLEDRMRDQLRGMLVLESVEDPLALLPGRLSTMSARWFTDSSPSRSAKMIRTRVASARIENTSTASSTNWLSGSRPQTCSSASIRRYFHVRSVRR